MIFLLVSVRCTKDDPADLPGKMKGWAAGSAYDGYGVILHTDNGGRTWIRQGSRDEIPEVTIEYISAINDKVVWACGDSINGKPVILKTTDGGCNWQQLGLDRNIPAVSYGGIGGTGENIAWAVGQQNVIIKTTDGGQTWTRQNLGGDPAFDLNGIAVADENHVWAAGASSADPYIAYITFTNDGGEHWYRQGISDIPEEVTGFIDIHAISPMDAWVVGTGQGALRTRDGGQTWETMQPAGGMAHNNGVCMADKDNVWMATDYSAVYHYSESYQQWQQFSLPTSSQAVWPVTIGVTTLNQNIVWAVTSAGGDLVKGEIFFTDNGGSTWVKQEIPVTCMLRRISFPAATR